MTEKSTSELFKEHIDELLRLAEENEDLMARKSLACMSLLAEGWRFGDPDPVDPGPDGGGEKHPTNIIRLPSGDVGAIIRRAA